MLVSEVGCGGLSARRPPSRTALRARSLHRGRARSVISAVAGVHDAVGVLLARRGVSESLRREVQIFHAEMFCSVGSRGAWGRGCVMGHLGPFSCRRHAGAGLRFSTHTVSCAARALIAARKAAVVARTRESPHPAQLTATARVFWSKSSVVTASARRCWSVLQVAHQGRGPRGWWAFRGRYVLAVTASQTSPR